MDEWNIIAFLILFKRYVWLMTSWQSGEEMGRFRVMKEFQKVKRKYLKRWTCVMTFNRCPNREQLPLYARNSLTCHTESICDFFYKSVWNKWLPVIKISLYYILIFSSRVITNLMDCLLITAALKISVHRNSTDLWWNKEKGV